MDTPDNVSNNPRPKLSDPKEYAIVKKVYFGDSGIIPSEKDLDPLEQWERHLKRIKTRKQQSR